MFDWKAPHSPTIPKQSSDSPAARYVLVNTLILAVPIKPCLQNELEKGLSQP